MLVRVVVVCYMGRHLAYSETRGSGRGGIGRRAALRSLWGNPRGSSSLLDRTIFFFLKPDWFLVGTRRLNRRRQYCDLCLFAGRSVGIDSLNCTVGALGHDMHHLVTAFFQGLQKHG